MRMSENLYETELGMSNFDHTVDEGFEDEISDGDCYGRHAGWNFNGLVYKADGKFYEDVYRFGCYCETLSADSLLKLMEVVNDVYGWE